MLPFAAVQQGFYCANYQERALMLAQTHLRIIMFRKLNVFLLSMAQ
jgi:hypothetical protein